jgi:hypothetical protein
MNISDQLVLEVEYPRRKSGVFSSIMHTKILLI